MGKLKLQLSDNPNELIYFQPVEASRECEAGLGDKILDGFEDVLANIKKFAEGVQEKIIEVNSPDKVSVELNFGLSAEAGKVIAILVNSQVSAGIKIALTWERDKER